MICQSKESLEIYGDGSDYERATHSRVFYTTLLPTHKITCQVNQGAIDELTGQIIAASTYDFDRFVDFESDFYTLGPRFDYVLLNESISTAQREVVVSAKSVQWQVGEV